MSKRRLNSSRKIIPVISLLFLLLLSLFIWHKDDNVNNNIDSELVVDNLPKLSILFNQLVSQSELRNFSSFSVLSRALDEALSQPKSNLNLRGDPSWFLLMAELTRSIHMDRLARNNRRKRLVCYICDKECGGLGDQMRGQVLGFLGAIGSDSQFCVASLFPVPRSWYFEYHYPTPSYIADNQFVARWIYMAVKAVVPFYFCSGQGSLYFNAYSSVPVARFTHYESDPGRIYENEGLMKALGSGSSEDSAIFIKSNQLSWREFMMSEPLKSVIAAHYPYLLRLTSDELASICAMSIFKGPTPKFAEYLAPYLPLLQGDEASVGVHFRTGDKELAHGDAARHSLEQVDCVVAKIKDVCGRESLDCPVFLASDSEIALAMMKSKLREGNYKMDNVITLEVGISLHIDNTFDENFMIKSEADSTDKLFMFDNRTFPHESYSTIPSSFPSSLFLPFNPISAYLAPNSERVRDAYLKTFGDWYLLSQCRRKILSESGFSGSARWISAGVSGGIDFRLRADDSCKWDEIN